MSPIIGKCLAVVIAVTIAGTGEPHSFNEVMVAELGMDGRWYVPDWDNLERMRSTETSNRSRCLGYELVMKRETGLLTSTPDTSCPEHFDRVSWDRILDADPIWQACKNIR